MLQLLCFLAEMLLLYFILFILSAVPKPPPLYLGKWRIKNDKAPSNPYEKTIWQLHDFKFELTTNGEYIATNNLSTKRMPAEKADYRVVGGGEYLIIHFAQTKRTKKDLGFLSFEDRIMLGGGG